MTFDDAHRFIKRGDIASLRSSLDEGASPDLSNRFSWTLLMLAALEGNTPIGELLISRGAAPNRGNDFGETAVSLAAHGGHAPFIRLLLQNGASTDCRPHGHCLKEWVKVSSGLPENRLASILELLTNAGAS